MSLPLSLRPLPLPDGVPGRVFLSRMPSRTGNFEAYRDLIVETGIDTVVCLTPLAEVEARSQDYYASIEQSTIPWHQVMSPMESFSVPQDRSAWMASVRQAADELRKGGSV